MSDDWQDENLADKKKKKGKARARVRVGTGLTARESRSLPHESG